MAAADGTAPRLPALQEPLLEREEEGGSSEVTTQQHDPMAEANAMLQGGAPAAKFAQKGATLEGKIVSAETAQQTDVKTGAPLTWDDGNPRMQVVVTLQTAEYDDSLEGDDGMRRLFVKGQMQTAIRQAIAEAGEHGMARGGTLKVQFYDEKPTDLSAQKLYRAKYTPPAAISEGDWPDDDAPPPTATPF